jgi:multidrug efflux pump subunit AcrB
MMGLVRLALRRPYTSAIVAMIIMLAGAMSLKRMAVDIFPPINIPVIMVAWNYGGLSAEEMERRVVLIAERSYSQNVDGIDHIESVSLPGVGLIKIFFNLDAEIGSAVAQINAVNNQVLRLVPPGMSPPAIVPFNASNVGVVQMTASSDTIPEQQLVDYSTNFIRLKLFTIPGISLTAPYGGKQRQIIVEIDPMRLSAKGVSPNEVVQAVQASNVIVPAGVARIGGREYNVMLNSSPSAVDQFNQIPLQTRSGIPVLLGDVASVTDSFATQTSMVHVNGKRATYVTILRHSTASTLAVVEATRDLMPELRAAAPEGFDLSLDFDQSVFVRSAIENVVHEALVSSILVSLMILVFLGSWRNMLIVSLSVAILDGSSEVVMPLTVATLAICIVFFPVVLLTGPSRFLFIPLAITVVLAMLASYFLSFSIVPTLTRMLLDGAHHGPTNPLARAFERGFEAFAELYARSLERVLAARGFVLSCFAGLVAVTGVLGTAVGTDFFPTADVGLIKLHFTAPVGTRLEETEKLVLEVQKKIREIIPPEEVTTINDVVGVPFSYNLALVGSDSVSSADADILIQLNKGHRPTIEYIRRIRAELPAAFPGSKFYFQTADIVSQVLNFGLSAPIDIQIEDRDLNRAYALAQDIQARLKKIPGIADPNIKQTLDYPALRVEVDRLRAAQLGISQRDVSNNVLISLSSSSFVSPSYYLNPVNNVNYFVAVRLPVDQVRSVDDLMGISISAPPAPAGTPPGGQPTASSLATQPNAPVSRLSDIASIRAGSTMQSISHYSVQRVVDVTANVDGRDLGGVTKEIRAMIAEISKDLPITTHITLRGQPEVMETSFSNLSLGLVLAIVLVYALLVVLFQSWIDPFIIMMALPGALVGIVWMLFLTGTTVNVVSLMGTIMTIGISVSNSILVVSFANDIRSRDMSLSPHSAAVQAARTRLRPILMTALAMVLGMIPMALGSGEAGEQNAPLGRAVIGGLAAATLATLYIVPIFYTLLRQKAPRLHQLDEAFAAEASAPSAKPAE